MKKKWTKHLQDFHFFRGPVKVRKKVKELFRFFRIFISLGGLLEEVSEKRL